MYFRVPSALECVSCMGDWPSGTFREMGIRPNGSFGQATSGQPVQHVDWKIHLTHKQTIMGTTTSWSCSPNYAFVMKSGRDSWQLSGLHWGVLSPRQHYHPFYWSSLEKNLHPNTVFEPVTFHLWVSNLDHSINFNVSNICVIIYSNILIFVWERFEWYTYVNACMIYIPLFIITIQ